jgi:heat shock protein 1/8
VSKSQTFSTNADNQSSVEIKVYEGERPLVAQCNCLGTFRLTDITPAARGVPRITVTYDIDANGILVVSAVDEKGGKKHAITIQNIQNEKGRLSKQQIDQMLKEAQQFEEEDRKHAETIEWRNTLENLIFSLRTTLQEPDIVSGVTELNRQNIGAACNSSQAWLDDNQNASPDDYKAKVKELEAVANPILTAFYSERALRSTQQPGAAAADGSGAAGAGAAPANEGEQKPQTNPDDID